MTLSGTNISMIRGDTETLTVRCSVPFAEGDTVFLTVKESVDSTEAALQELVDSFGPEGEAVITISHEDTEWLELGSYVYDIQVTRADGTVKTLVPRSRFTLEEDVTRD